MNEAELFYIFTREDLAPETALEVAAQATSLDEMYRILVNLGYYFSKAVMKAEADDKTKADVILRYGEFLEVFSLAIKAYPMIAMARINNYNEGHLYHLLKDYLMDIAHLYADVKNGESLRYVKSKLDARLSILHVLIEDYIEYSGLLLRDLYKKQQSLTAEA